MKKIFILIILVIVSLMFTACGSSPEAQCLKSCSDLLSIDQLQCEDACRMGDREYDNSLNDVTADSSSDKSSNTESEKGVCDEKWTYFECEEFSGQYKDSCYAELASDKEQECICTNKVDDAGLKNACYAAVANTKLDYTICDNIDSVSYETIQDGCYSAIAEETQSIDPCNKMNNEMLKDGCYQMVASQLSDADICDMISNSAIKMACEMELS